MKTYLNELVTMMELPLTLSLSLPSVHDGSFQSAVGDFGDFRGGFWWQKNDRWAGRERKKKQNKKCNGRRDEEKRKYWFLISRNDSLKTRSKRKKKTKQNTKTKLYNTVKMRKRSGEKKNYTYTYLQIPHDEGG